LQTALFFSSAQPGGCGGVSPPREETFTDFIAYKFIKF
jgi:hypothetical protein